MQAMRTASRSAAAATSPASRAVRTRLLDTSCPSRTTGGTTSSGYFGGPAQFGQQNDVALAPPSEAEVRSLDQRPRRQSLPQHLLEEVGGRQRQQFRRGPHHDDVIEAEMVQQSGPVGGGAERRRSAAGA